MKFTGNNEVVNNNKLNSKVTVKGEGVSKLQSENFKSAKGNINVKADGKGTLEVQLAKDIDLGNDGSVRAGNTVVNNRGVSVKNGPSITQEGIDAGSKRITDVAPGVKGTDAVNVNQLKGETVDIRNDMNRLDKNLRAGIAGAIATGGLYHATLPGKSMVSAGVGTYKGEGAISVGYSRLSDNGKVGIKFSVNTNSRGDAGAAASMGYQW
ncbi:autotransporter adhesin [Rodentibacter pneumotropicus]|uniref:Autotransporter adhesin n=1 Tax=Rodentibacter pneumotropicus TaxID=758 RepID=A0A3S4XT63_9PAST|nr:autotransporter adhesin [Rodentibacter pneumotropicus]